MPFAAWLFLGTAVVVAFIHFARKWASTVRQDADDQEWPGVDDSPVQELGEPELPVGLDLVQEQYSLTIPVAEEPVTVEVTLFSSGKYSFIYSFTIPVAEEPVTAEVTYCSSGKKNSLSHELVITFACAGVSRCDGKCGPSVATCRGECDRSCRTRRGRGEPSAVGSEAVETAGERDRSC